MGMDLSITTEQKAAPTAHSWLRSAHGTQACESITLDGNAFAADITNWANGVVKAGCVIGLDTSSGLYAPYDNAEANTTTNEVQTLTVDASSGTFDLTVPATAEPGWEGLTLPQTVTAIASEAAAATIQTDLEAILGVGNVTVTGSAGGPYTITFLGALAQTNAPLLTTNAASLGGTGAHTAVVTVPTPGGSGAGVAKGFLFQAVDLTVPKVSFVQGSHPGNITASLLWHGSIDTSKIPYASGRGGLDATAKTDLAAQFRFTTT